MALLLVLGLVALLAVLVMSIAAVLASSHRTAAVSGDRRMARQNALYALDEALARLQELAGPDSRLTATADTDDDGANRRWTGVWEHAAGVAPVSWLVSGNSTAAPLAFTPAAPGADTILLVGAGSVGAASDPAMVRAPAVAMDGTAGAARYAWWVGDEGVKAAIGQTDSSTTIAYPPFDRPEMRATLRAQAGREAEFLSPDEASFDPLSAGNRAALANLVSLAQVDELTPFGTESLSSFAVAHHHEFTAQTWGVLANTRTDARRGLKHDLSLDPTAMGAGWGAFLDYGAAMESVDIPSTSIPPIANAGSMRRRYRITPPFAPIESGQPVFSVAPVLTELLLQFSIQRAGPVVQVKARVFVGLWNPYSSALVPDTLQLRLTGLPTVLATDLVGGGSQAVNLQSIFGGAASPPCLLTLPFASTGTNDTVSWLPGRWYGWTTPTGVSPGAPLHFYDKNISASGWLATSSIPGTAHLTLACPTTTRLMLSLAKSDGTVLATATSPDFPAFAIPDSMATTQGGWNFGFGFRLHQADSQSTDRSWLVTAGLDPRAPTVSPTAFGPFDPAKSLNPAAYFGTPVTATGLEHFLLFRSLGGTSNTSVSANNDAPMFELPRQPVVNAAEFRHLQIAGVRPFSVGNSWAPVNGDGMSANALFDQAFLSGLSSSATNPDLSAGESLPNSHLKVFDSRSSPSAPLVLSDVLATAGDSARFLLVAGAFNCNATSWRAWQAELSRLRFGDDPWPRADIDNSSSPSPTLGTQVAAIPGTVSEIFADDLLGGPGFAIFRFSQSAQETYAATALADSRYPSRVPFRRGVRGGNNSGSIPGFPSDAIAALASAISQRVRHHLATSGPFRDLEEFLQGSAEFGGRSLLEDAILGAGLNPAAYSPLATVVTASDPGLCSLTFTPADLLGLLAPVLQTRSDTFVVRAYGEIRSWEGNVAARAWCEARVQRTPVPVLPGDDWKQPVGALGRRFRVLSFRWLRPQDV